MTRNKLVYLSAFAVLLSACTDYFKNDYRDNSPTSGKLKVYYDEGLRLHVRNQAATFESIYHLASFDLHEVTESDAVLALLNDSCEAIVIERDLSETELKAFASRKYHPQHSIVASTGIALIANRQSGLKYADLLQISALLKNGQALLDSTGKEIDNTVLFDKNNSGVLHYLLDSVVRGKALSNKCTVLNGSLESIDYVATHKNAIAFIDFSWISDQDDPLNKKYDSLIRVIPLALDNKHDYAYPDQSNFKLGRYPLMRQVYVFRKTGEFSLAKGFEAFVAGPKGQLIFLKQGLLPYRQAERSIHVTMENKQEE